MPFSLGHPFAVYYVTNPFYAKSLGASVPPLSKAAIRALASGDLVAGGIQLFSGRWAERSRRLCARPPSVPCQVGLCGGQPAPSG